MIDVRMLTRVPCSFCSSLCPESKLELHEDVCEKNPANQEGKPLIEFALTDEQIAAREKAEQDGKILPRQVDWATIKAEIVEDECRAAMRAADTPNQSPVAPAPRKKAAKKNAVEPPQPAGLTAWT